MPLSGILTEDMEKNGHMIVGKVVGSIVSTRKSEKLIGNKFMIVEPVHHMKAEHSQIVAIDIIGAGIGEYVWWHKEAQQE